MDRELHRHLPASVPAPASAPVRRLTYVHQRYADGTRCVAGIRERLQDGWQVTQIRGGETGPFLVVFQKDVLYDYRGPARRR
jgi:hypothetical protein